VENPGRTCRPGQDDAAPAVEEVDDDDVVVEDEAGAEVEGELDSDFAGVAAGDDSDGAGAPFVLSAPSVPERESLR
jgi:hypothetical protein